MPDRITVSRWSFLHLLALCLMALSATAPGANAQVSAYGVAGVNGYGFSFRGNAPSSYYDTAGFGGGAFYNFPIRSRVTVGIDGRVFYGPGSYGGTTADAALRIGFVPAASSLRYSIQDLTQRV
jgi:hypothetical protein